MDRKDNSSSPQIPQEEEEHSFYQMMSEFMGIQTQILQYLQTKNEIVAAPVKAKTETEFLIESLSKSITEFT